MPKPTVVEGWAHVDECGIPYRATFDTSEREAQKLCYDECIPVEYQNIQPVRVTMEVIEDA